MKTGSGPAARRGIGARGAAARRRAPVGPSDAIVGEIQDSWVERAAGTDAAPLVPAASTAASGTSRTAAGASGDARGGPPRTP